MPPSKWKCPICNERFGNESRTRQHIQDKHEKRTGKTGEPIEVVRRPDDDLSEWQYMHQARGWPY